MLTPNVLVQKILERRSETKGKRKKREEQADKGNNITPFPALPKTDAIIALCVVFFFLDSSAPMCLQPKKPFEAIQPVCVPVRYVKTLEIKRERKLLCTDDPVSDTNVNARTPNAIKTNMVKLPIKDSDRRMYVLYMQ